MYIIVFGSDPKTNRLEVAEWRSPNCRRQERDREATEKDEDWWVHLRGISSAGWIRESVARDGLQLSRRWCDADEEPVPFLFSSSFHLACFWNVECRLLEGNELPRRGDRRWGRATWTTRGLWDGWLFYSTRARVWRTVRQRHGWSTWTPDFPLP